MRLGGFGMIPEKDLLSIEVATLYYELDQTQQEIAETLNISRPTVSKLLKHAKQQNYIQITIKKPVEAIHSLELRLKEKFGLDDVRVAYANHATCDATYVLQLLGKEASAYLNEVVQHRMKIGISWGETLYHVAKELQQKQVEEVEVVQLKGGMNFIQANTHDQEIMMRFVQNFHAKGQYVPLPIVFNSVETKNALLAEPQFHLIHEKMGTVDVAIYTIGEVSKESLLYKTNVISEHEFDILSKQAVCDICSRFIDENGEIVLEELDERTVGISLEALKNVPKSILIANGESKLEGIKTALKQKIPNVFITDSMTALKLLE